MRPIEAGLTIAILASAAVPAGAQTPVRPVPAVLITAVAEPVVVPPNEPRAIVDRVFSFDADGDERVSAGELPERMTAMLARADQNGDGFLTANEVVLGRTPSAVVEGRAIVVNRPSALADVVDDLKLPSPVREQAIAIVSRHRVPRNLTDADSAAMHAAMKELLDEEDSGNFAAAVARLRFGSFSVRTTVRPGSNAGPSSTP